MVSVSTYIIPSHFPFFWANFANLVVHFLFSILKLRFLKSVPGTDYILGHFKKRNVRYYY